MEQLNNYIIINEDNMSFEALNCKNIKEAVERYILYLIPNNDKLKTYLKIFDSDVLTLKELINIFYMLFSDELVLGEKIATIYNVNSIKKEDFEK